MRINFRHTARRLTALALATAAAATMSVGAAQSASAADVPPSGLSSQDLGTPGTGEHHGENPHSIGPGNPLDCNDPDLPESYKNYCASIPVVDVSRDPKVVLAYMMQTRCRGLSQAACLKLLHWNGPAPAPTTNTPLHHMRPVHHGAGTRPALHHMRPVHHGAGTRPADAAPADAAPADAAPADAAPADAQAQADPQFTPLHHMRPVHHGAGTADTPPATPPVDAGNDGFIPPR